MTAFTVGRQTKIRMADQAGAFHALCVRSATLLGYLLLFTIFILRCPFWVPYHTTGALGGEICLGSFIRGEIITTCFLQVRRNKHSKPSQRRSSHTTRDLRMPVYFLCHLGSRMNE